jgi:hypothetical protein
MSESQKDSKAESKDSSVEKVDDIILGDKTKDADKKEVASIDDLKAAYLDLESGKVSVKQVKEEVEEGKEVKVDEDDLDGLLDEVVKSNEVESAKKRESLVEKTDRSDLNKIKELERKLEELTNAKLAPQIQPMSPEWFEKVAEECGMDVDEVQRITKVLNIGFNGSVKPFVDNLYTQINELKDKLSHKDIAESNSKDKLFKLIKPDYDDILANDETVKSLPPEHRNKVALALAKEKNIEKVLDIVRKAKVGSSKKLVVNDSGSVNAPAPKKASGVQLSKEDLYVASQLGYSAKDLENLGKSQKSFIEE